AATRIKTSPGPGTGSGRSTTLSTSGGPGVEISTPRIVHPERRRQSRRRNQPGELTPAIGAARFDVGRNHVLPEVVVDDVAAVLVDEPHALLGPRARIETVLLVPVGRGLRVDRAIE